MALYSPPRFCNRTWALREGVRSHPERPIRTLRIYRACRRKSVVLLISNSRTVHASLYRDRSELQSYLKREWVCENWRFEYVGLQEMRRVSFIVVLSDQISRLAGNATYTPPIRKLDSRRKPSMVSRLQRCQTQQTRKLCAS